MSDGLLFILITLAAYRIWRLIAEDSFPPTEKVVQAFESAVKRRFGVDWAAGVYCPWCSGFHCCVLIWAITWAFRPLPLPFIWPWAMSTAVGFLAQRDEA